MESLCGDDVEWDAEGRLYAASSSSFLHLLLPPSQLAASTSYAFTILLNLRTLMSSLEMITTMLHLTVYSHNSTANNFSKENRFRLFSAIYTTCSVWTKEFPHDFQDENMMRRLEELLSVCSSVEDEPNKQQIIFSLNTQLNRISRFEKALGSLAEKKGIELSSDDNISGLFAISMQHFIIAQQLTHIELERLSMLSLREVLSTVSDSSDLSSFSTLHLSQKGVRSAIAWFNRLSSLVSSEILRHSHKRHRASVIEYWVDVAHTCFQGGNFNSTCAIVAALNSEPISRLKRTWSRVDSAKLSILQHQLDPTGNFSSYRATMKAAQWRAEEGHTDEEKIIIPFFIILLKDLFMIYHGTPRILPNGLLNYKAFEQIAACLRPLTEWKRRNYSLERNAHILQFLLAAPIHDERILMIRSFDYEEPITSAEKYLQRDLR